MTAEAIEQIVLGEPPPAQKVCIIGSSYIGALLQAYREFPNDDWHHHFSFFGAAFEDFPQLAIRNGKITGFTYKTRDAVEDIAHYDYFAVYGDMMIPHEIAHFEVQLAKANHSRALRYAMMNDWTRLRHSRTVAEGIAAITRAPVFILPRNVTVEDKPTDIESYALGVRMLSAFLNPVVFLEMPGEILGDGFITDPAYHKGSVMLGGNASKHSGHDLAHMNITGGRMMLRHIARAVTRDYSSKV